MCLSYAVFLFFSFEVPSQLKMISFTRLSHKFLKVHEDHTAIVQSLHGLRTRAARVSCDIRAISMYGCGDITMTAQSPYNLSSILHQSVVETPSKKSQDGRINVNT